MMIEERFAQTDFVPLSRVKNSLLIQLKLRRRAINEEMGLDELNNVTAAGLTYIKPDTKDNPRR